MVTQKVPAWVFRVAAACVLLGTFSRFSSWTRRDEEEHRELCSAAEQKTLFFGKGLSFHPAEQGFCSISCS
eukprot:g6737.t1